MNTDEHRWGWRPRVSRAERTPRNLAGMPRTARASVADTWYHAPNRGNRRAEVFRMPAEHDAFVKAMTNANARLPGGRNGEQAEMGDLAL